MPSPTDVLRADVDADGKRIANLGAPASAQSATYTDNVSTPLAAGAATPGSSFLAAPADHVHPASGQDYDRILVSDPAAPSAIYTPTYGAGVTAGLLISEAWKNLANATIKTVDYAYVSGRVSTEVRKAYDASTGNVVAQVTITNVYSAGLLQSSTTTRDVGSSNNSIDFLLESDPISASISYSATYGIGGMTDELWSLVSSGLAIKSVHYVYSAGLLASEVRKVFGADGATTVGQLTISYSYSSNLLTSITQTRDV